MNTLLIRLVNSTKRVLTSMVAPDRALEFSMMRRPKYSRAPFLGLPIGTYFLGECAVVLNVRSSRIPSNCAVSVVSNLKF